MAFSKKKIKQYFKDLLENKIVKITLFWKAAFSLQFANFKLSKICPVIAAAFDGTFDQFWEPMIQSIV